MFDIESYHSFPGYGKKFETEKDLFFLSTCCIPRKFYLLGTFFEVSQQPANQECCIGFAWQT